METIYSVLGCVQSFKQPDLDNMFGEGDENKLDVKEAAVFNKYLLAGMALLAEKDSKATNMVNFATLLNGQLKMKEVFGQSVLLKSMFERQPIMGGVKAPE